MQSLPQRPGLFKERGCHNFCKFHIWYYIFSLVKTFTPLEFCWFPGNERGRLWGLNYWEREVGLVSPNTLFNSPFLWNLCRALDIFARIYIVCHKYKKRYTEPFQTIWAHFLNWVSVQLTPDWKLEVLVKSCGPWRQLCLNMHTA